MKHMKTILIAFIGGLVLFPLLFANAGNPPGSGDMLSKKCLKCHSGLKDMKDTLAGNFKSRSNKAKTIQMKINNGMQLVQFTKDTTIKNVPSIKALKGTIPIRVHYKKVGADLVATEIVAKPEMKVPEDQLVSTPELEKLVALGPEKGKYTLVDSRPGNLFMTAHIPTAISIPFPKMKKMMAKLPKDKNRQVIFYCEGFR